MQGPDAPGPDSAVLVSRTGTRLIRPAQTVGRTALAAVAVAAGVELGQVRQLRTTR